MPDPIETMLKTEAEVTRLWNQARPGAGNRDVQTPDPLPMSSRVMQMRGKYFGAPEARINDTVHNHPRAADALDTLIVNIKKTDHGHPSLAERIDCETPAAEEEAEEKDRLIVLPKRGDEEVEDPERFDEAFDGQRK
jgi:hypothetical protein